MLRNIVQPSDPCYADELQRILEEIGRDFSDDEECSEEYNQENSHSMDSEIPESDNENIEIETETSSTKYYYGKWTSNGHLLSLKKMCELLHII